MSAPWINGTEFDSALGSLNKREKTCKKCSATKMVLCSNNKLKYLCRHCDTNEDCAV